MTRERSQAIAATAREQSPSPSSIEPALAPNAEQASKKSARKLCDGRLSKSGTSLPKTSIAHVVANAGAETSAALPTQAGTWVWVNFWAAWCIPCKEEIPRLKSWEARLLGSGSAFQVVFVSLDDDTRQLNDFLKSQPAAGLRSTYWLREGKERESWLKAAGLAYDPALPMHLLVDPKGKVRCTVHGAVEDSEFEQLVLLLRP